MHHIVPGGAEPRDGRLRICERCPNTTRRGKSVCPDHLDELPDWAAARAGWQAYLEEVARLEADLEACALERDVVLGGLVAEDVRNELRRGGRTIARIAEDLTLPAAAVVVVARALVLAGEVRLSVPTARLEELLPKRVIVELA